MRTPHPKEIRRQVEVICLHPPLDIARLRRALLDHIVEATLASKPTTEKAIAVTIYRRDPETFDPMIDNIVRVEVRELRKGLNKFYASDQGQRAPIRIVIEKYAAVVSTTAYYVPNLDLDEEDDEERVPPSAEEISRIKALLESLPSTSPQLTLPAKLMELSIRSFKRRRARMALRQAAERLKALGEQRKGSP